MSLLPIPIVTPRPDRRLIASHQRSSIEDPATAMSTNPHQLFLLADHLKLSLLERQRAIALNLEPTKQDGHIGRSLETLREGLETLERQQADAEDAGEE